MNKSGPVIIIDDDDDDQDIYQIAFSKLGFKNEIVFFSDGNDALTYLRDQLIRPFIILCDINMPLIDGFKLRSKIFEDDHLRSKCIPFLFFTTAATKASVDHAYEMSVQGFFRKPGSIEGFQNTIGKILDYWREGMSPGSFG